MPIEKDADLSIERLKNLPKEQPDALFFWVWGAEPGGSTDDVVIWLNGGPGCSSNVGNLEEVGPIDASDLDAGIKLRPDRWTKDANLLIVDQPVGTGFSSGDPSINNEEELAAQFYDFYTNLVRVFPELSKMTLSIIAESYGGYYGPNIASYFLDQEETYNLAGLITIDGVLASDNTQESLVYYDFVKKNQKLLNVTDQDLQGLEDVAKELGYYGYVDKYLKYPPDGPLPVPSGDLFIGGVDDYYDAACYAGNPNFNRYDVRDRSDGGTSISEFLSKTEVQDYIHAPHIDFSACDYRDVFPDGDDSPPTNAGILPKVVEDERMKQVIVAQGIYDGLLVDLGAELALANMTWSGKQGFSEPPTSVIVGYDGKPQGHFTKDRGLTYAAIDNAGHMVSCVERSHRSGLARAGGDRITDCTLPSTLLAHL